MHFSSYIKDNYDSNVECYKDNHLNILDLEEQDAVKEINEIFFREGNRDINPFIGIVDSGCPKSVAGKPWMDAFVESKGVLVKRSREAEHFKFEHKPYKKNIPNLACLFNQAIS